MDTPMMLVIAFWIFLLVFMHLLHALRAQENRVEIRDLPRYDRDKGVR